MKGLVFNKAVRKMLDIGGNTGKWAIAAVEFDRDLQVTILDLPGQLELAKAKIQNLGLERRISFIQMDILDESQAFPVGFDSIWMSQFLDCFSEREIYSIVKRCYESLPDDGTLFILEAFWDKQRFESAAFCLQQTSLYFTAIANGNSQMYHSEVFISCISRAGFEVIQQTDHIGLSHSLLTCKKISDFIFQLQSNS